MKIKITQTPAVIKEVRLFLNAVEAGSLKLILENHCFGHHNRVELNIEQELYYPLKNAMRNCNGSPDPSEGLFLQRLENICNTPHVSRDGVVRQIKDEIDMYRTLYLNRKEAHDL
jgi:hypothetical protein